MLFPLIQSYHVAKNQYSHVVLLLLSSYLCVLSYIAYIHNNSHPGIKSLISLLSSKILSFDKNCGRVEFSVNSVLVNFIRTAVLPVCCRS